MAGWRSAAILTLFVGAGAAHIPSEAGRLYWTSASCGEFDCGPSRILSSDLNGSDTQTLLWGESADFGGIAIDTDSNQVYWGNSLCFDSGQVWQHGIWSASIEGCRQIAASEHRARFLEIDPAGKKIYWMSSHDSIWRADLDSGDNVERLVAAAYSLFGLALDLVNGKIYWGDISGEPGVWRANLDGSAPELVIAEESVRALDVDVDGGMVYWLTTTALRRAELDGSYPTDLVADDLMHPSADVELDLVNNKVYWVNNDTCLAFASKISRADLDGSNPEIVLSDLNFVSGLAIDPVGDGIGQVTCEPPAVPALGLEGGLVLLLALLVLSTFLARDRRRQSR